MDYRMTVTFTHESGSPTYSVPGYFAADGDAANSSATSGNKWRAHLAPDKTGRWNYRISFVVGQRGRAGRRRRRARRWRRSTARTGTIQIAATDKTRARLSRARPAAVRRQALSAVCRQRRVLPEARRRLARDAAGVRRLRRHRRAQAAGAASHLRAARAGLEGRRPDVEGRQGQGADRRRQLSGVERRERDFVPAVQRRRRRRQRLAVRRAATTSSTTTCRSSTSGRSSSITRSRRASTCTSSCRKTRSTTTCAEIPASRHAAVADRRDGTGARVARRRRPRAGAQALHARARRAIRLRAGAELEHRRREHAVERAAARDGDESQGHRSLRRPSHRRPHVSERAGEASIRRCWAASRRLPARRCRWRGTPCTNGRCDGCSPRRRRRNRGSWRTTSRARRVSACLPIPATRASQEKMRKGATSATRSTTFASTRCGAI